MKLLLGGIGLLVVLVSLLLGIAAWLDYLSHKRELELTFNAPVVEKYQSETLLYHIVVEDSIGPIVVSRVTDELFEFVEPGDTLIKKEGDATCLVQNQPMHKHHMFEVYKHSN